MDDKLVEAIRNLMVSTGTLAELVRNSRVTNPPNPEQKRIEVGTQTISASQLSKCERMKEIKVKIKRGMGDEEILSIAREDWPEESYQHVNYVHGGFKIDDSGATLAIGYPEELRQNEAVRCLAEQVPSLNVVLDERFPGPGKTVLVRSTETITEDENEERGGQRLVIVGGLPEAMGNREQDIVQIVRRAVSAAVKYGINLIAILPGKSLCPAFIRKIAECCLAGTNIMATILGKEHVEISTSVTRTATLLIKAADTKKHSFADVVSELKRQVSPEEAGVRIERLTKTEEGDVRLVLKETKTGGTEQLKNLIATRVRMAGQIEAKGHVGKILLKDINEGMARQEIIDAVAAASGAPKGSVSIPSDVRGPTLTVTLPIEAARRIIGFKRIEVGWARVKCRVQEKVYPVFCFRCQSFGHRMAACKAPFVNGRRCMRCGRVGHIAKQCTDVIPTCHTCNEKGHRVDSMVCPKYKAMVEKLKCDTNRKKFDV